MELNWWQLSLLESAKIKFKGNWKADLLLLTDLLQIVNSDFIAFYWDTL